MFAPEKHCNCGHAGWPVASFIYVGRLQKGTVRGRNGMRASGLVYSREIKMPQSNRDPVSGETGDKVQARPHDSGSAANKTDDGLDATAEAIRHAAEDTPSGTGPGDIEKTPVFDRAGLAPKI